MRGQAFMRRNQAAALQSFEERRNSAYFVHELVAEPLFWTGKPV
jgi:hypothetical protein